MQYQLILKIHYRETIIRIYKYNYITRKQSIMVCGNISSIAPMSLEKRLRIDPII